MRNTSFNGIRFNFKRDFKEAFKVIYGGVAFSIVTLGFGTPTALFWRNQFAANYSAYGKTSFSYASDSGGFYEIFWKSIGLVILGYLATMMLMIPLTEAISSGGSDLSLAAIILEDVILVLVLLIYLCSGIYAQVRQRNLVWSHLKLGDNTFESTLSVRSMVWIYVSNIAAIVASFGMLVPWAKIRLARYRAEHTHVVMVDEWSEFVSANTRDESAIGDEIGSAFDVEVDVAF